MESTGMRKHLRLLERDSPVVPSFEPYLVLLPALTPTVQPHRGPLTRPGEDAPR